MFVKFLELMRGFIMFVIKMIDLDFVGKCVFICVDLNVLVKDGKVISDVCICVFLLIIELVLK